MLDICRLCLNRYEMHKLQNIFECKVKISDEDDGLSNVLFWTFGVEVDVSDLYAKTICDKCIGLVDQVLKCRKVFQYNQDLLKDGLFLSEIGTSVNTEIGWDLFGRLSETNENKIGVPVYALELVCPQPTVTIRKLEQTFDYQEYKKIGPRSFKKRKRPKLELDDSIVNDICRSLESSKFQDLSNPTTRTIGVNTSEIASVFKNCNRCENTQQSPFKISEDCTNVDQDSGVENDEFVQDIIQKSVNLDSRDDFDDWTQMTFKKDVGVGTDVILTHSVAVSTDINSIKHDIDDFKKFKLKIKSSYFDEKQDDSTSTKKNKNLQSFSEEKFDTFLNNIDKEKISHLVQKKGEEEMFEHLYNKTIYPYIRSSQPETKEVGTITKRPRYVTKAFRDSIIKRFLKQRRKSSITVGTSTSPVEYCKSKSRSIATITEPLPKDKFVVDEESLELFSPVVLLTPLEYTVEKTYEQINDTTFVLKDSTDPELLKERQKRYIDYYYGFSSFGIRELVAGTVFRDKEKENTDMAVCQVSSVCDIYICNLCSKQFTSRSALKSHSATYHNKDDDDEAETSDKRKQKKRKNGYTKAKKCQTHKKKSNTYIENKLVKVTDISNPDFGECLKHNTIKSNQSDETELILKETQIKEYLRPPHEDIKYNQMKLQLSENNVDLVFSCSKCIFSCNDEFALYSHRRVVHALENPSELSNTKELNHIEIEFACDNCDFYFDDEQSLCRHQIKSHGIGVSSTVKEEISSESEPEIVDVENDRRFSQSMKKNCTQIYVWESKKFGKYSASSSTKQKLNLLNSSDESCSSPNVTPQKKELRRSPNLEDDLETVRYLQKKLKGKRQELFLDGTISKLTKRLDEDES